MVVYIYNFLSKKKKRKKSVIKPFQDPILHTAVHRICVFV